MSMAKFSDFAKNHGAPEEVSREFQLSFDDVIPRRWFLSINGSGAHLIKSSQLNEQRPFRNWCSDHGYKPPKTEKQHVFEEMVGELYDTAVKNEGTLPFFQTDAGCAENLEVFFSTHIPHMVRAKGDEFLNGKCGDYVRVRVDVERIYFKWQRLKHWCQRSLNLHDRDLDAMKMFISKKGGYQGEEGAREWFRWTYWMPLDVFDRSVVWGWLHPDEVQDVR
jgi:hypothetical protein